MMPRPQPLKGRQGAAGFRPEPWTAAAVRFRLRTFVAFAAAGALALSLGIVAAPAALGDSAPPDPASPASPPTVTADALPTVQVDGVVWQQVIVGNTVYAAGSFTTARPAGSPAGTGTVPRSNVLAYDVTTGMLLPFAPVLNGQALSVAASPDGTRIYVGGDFTSVNGSPVWRVAALDPSSGALITSFLPKMAASVRAIVPTADTVYMGGLFNAVGTLTRNRLAAASASNGAVLPWNPSADDGRVNALALSPDGSKVVVGGAFTTLNGSSNPGYGFAAVDPSVGGLLPWEVNNRVRNGGVNSAITSLSGDAENVYATGYVFGTGGNLEGIVAASWGTGKITWLDDCHGDTYAAVPVGDVIYKVGHAHYCGNIGGFPQTEPWSFHRGLAFSKAATGTIVRDPLGYPNWEGLPAPSLLNWFPDLNTGTVTGQNQGPWTVTGNSQYVVMGGEFTTVNGTPQQGLVRFTVTQNAPNTRGPVLGGSRINPTLTSPAAGTVRVRWQANYDQDNVRLTYKLTRDGDTANPIYTAVQDSTFWNRPGMTFVDTGLIPGQSYRYRLFVTDPFGNEARSDTVSIIPGSTTPTSSYGSAMLADSPDHFWRFNDVAGPTLVDSAGAEDLTASSGAGLRADGAMIGETTGAATLDGTVNGAAVDTGILRGSNSFTVEAWVRTTSSTGGRIFGFSNVASGTSRVTDRNVYMDNSGRIYFGAWNGSLRTVNSAAGFNNGQWHQIVASLSTGGMFLYVDGTRVAFRTDTTVGRAFDGYWRMGGDLLSGWPSRPGSDNFRGDVDELALYPVALGLQQVQAHYRASGRTLNVPPTPPTAAFTSSMTYLTLAADGSGSSDPNGPLVSYSWTFGDGTSATGATAQHVYATAGTYTVRLTVRDSDGNIASTTRNVTATAPPPNQAPVAAFTSNADLLAATFNGSASSDPDGTITSYAWDYGDGATASGPTASHTYDAPGTYAVQLTVTDNVGAVNSVTHSVTVVLNQPPIASFTQNVVNRSATFDASGSSDPDGTIAGYAWDFGDGSVGSGAQTTHAYAVAGTYQVTLTVTDNRGATATAGSPVTATDPPPNTTVASDTFGRTATGGWGTADTGGPWSVTGGSGNFAVNSGSGAITVPAPGTGPSAYLGDLSLDGTDSVVTVSADKVANGGGMFASLAGRRVGTNNDYRAKVRVASNGDVTLYLSRVVNGAETVLQQRTISGLNYSAGAQLQLRFAVAGTGPSSMGAKVWRTGTSEPAAWQLTATDSTAILQARGSAGLATYVSGSATNSPVVMRFDNLAVTTGSGTVTGTPPTAAFASSANGLAVSVDGSGSTDADGSVVSYAWDFGDGASASGTTASHTYAAAGTYQLTLTVTDNTGATGSAVQSVTVDGAAGLLAADAFGRVSASGWGSADTGGAWTVGSGVANYLAGNGVGTMLMGTAGATRLAYLPGVTATAADVQVLVSQDKIADGGGSFVGVIGRKAGADEYRAKLRIFANGTTSLYVTRLSGGTETTLQSVTVAGLTVAAGDQVHLRVQVTGTAPTTIRARVWRDGAAEPSTWLVSTVDTTASLQAAGSTGLMSYLWSSATNIPVRARFDDYLVRAP